MQTPPRPDPPSVKVCRPAKPCLTSADGSRIPRDTGRSSRSLSQHRNLSRASVSYCIVSSSRTSRRSTALVHNLSKQSSTQNPQLCIFSFLLENWGTLLRAARSSRPPPPPTSLWGSILVIAFARHGRIACVVLSTTLSLSLGLRQPTRTTAKSRRQTAPRPVPVICQSLSPRRTLSDLCRRLLYPT